MSVMKSVPADAAQIEKVLFLTVEGVARAMNASGAIYPGNALSQQADLLFDLLGGKDDATRLQNIQGWCDAAPAGQYRIVQVNPFILGNRDVSGARINPDWPVVVMVGEDWQFAEEQDGTGPWAVSVHFRLAGDQMEMMMDPPGNYE